MRANGAKIRAILKRQEKEAEEAEEDEGLPANEKAEKLAKLRGAISNIEAAWPPTAQA